MKSQKYFSDKIIKIFKENQQLQEKFLRYQKTNIAKVSTLIADGLKRHKKVIIFGNGGSAADSQHIAAELVGRFKKNREALPAVALSCNTSILTAVGNDLGFKHVFERQIKAIGQRQDIALGISTSGNSENVLLAVKAARSKGMFSVGLTGCGGGKLASMVNLAITVPSFNTPRIQEMHILAGHIICELVEEQLLKR